MERTQGLQDVSNLRIDCSVKDEKKLLVHGLSVLFFLSIMRVSNQGESG